MIDINQIRQGNIIKYAANDYWAKFIQGCEVVVDMDIYLDIDKHPVGFDPIELNPEWLDKLGFKKHEQSLFENIKMSYWVHEAVCLFFNEIDPETSFLAGYGFNTFDGKYYAATIRWIKHVHTLQNIFTSLTNKELTLKSFNQSN